MHFNLKMASLGLGEAMMLKRSILLFFSPNSYLTWSIELVLATRFFHFLYQKKSATKINKVSTKSEIFQAKIDN
jgi:hypothetical protein